MIDLAFGHRKRGFGGEDVIDVNFCLHKPGLWQVEIKRDVDGVARVELVGDGGGQQVAIDAARCPDIGDDLRGIGIDGRTRWPRCGGCLTSLVQGFNSKEGSSTY